MIELGAVLPPMKNEDNIHPIFLNVEGVIYFKEQHSGINNSFVSFCLFDNCTLYCTELNGLYIIKKILIMYSQ